MDFVGAITREIFHISWYWWLMTVIIMAIIWRGMKDKIIDSFIAGYIFIILVITVLNRSSGAGTAELVPFWSYKIPELRSEIILNYILFIPLGCLMGLKKIPVWKTWMYAAMVSLMIEIIQLVFKRGLFEFDDIFGNSVGCLIGAILIMIFMRGRKNV